MEGGDPTHLMPAARAAALRPDAERLALLRDGPGQIRPPNFLLAGPSNSGKSWIVERLVRAHALPSGEDAERLPVVAMQMPTEPTVARFYAALLARLGAPVASAGPGGRKHELEQLALRVLRGVGARMLIIDELNNILAGSRTARGEFLNLLRWLGNELRRPGSAVSPLPMTWDPVCSCAGHLASTLLRMTPRWTPAPGRPDWLRRWPSGPGCRRGASGP